MPFTVNRSNYLIPPETQFPDSSFRLSHNTGESLEFLVRLGGCPIRWGSNTHPQGKFLVPCQPHWPRDLPEVPQTLCSRLLSIPLIRTPPRRQAAVVARTLGPRLVQPQQSPARVASACPRGQGGLRQQGQGAGDGWTSPVSRTTWLRRGEGRLERSRRERPPTECTRGQARGTADLTAGAAGVSALIVRRRQVFPCWMNSHRGF